MPYLCTDIAGDPLPLSLSPFPIVVPLWGCVYPDWMGITLATKRVEWWEEGGAESRVRRPVSPPPWPQLPPFLAYWLPVNMQHCLTDCNEPQIDQATPGSPSPPPSCCRTPLNAYVCVLGNLWLISYAINPRATPHCPLPAARCLGVGNSCHSLWQHQLLPSLSPPLQRQGCILPGYCTNYELALLARGGVWRAAAGTGTGAGAGAGASLGGT